MINVPGQLAIRTITGRNGEFNVGRLSTSIGEFVIKDALLDQYTEGKYQGDFLITEIRPSYYSTGGRLVVEIRAKLESMALDTVDNLTAEDAAKLSANEQDPMDEDPSPSGTSPQSSKSTSTTTKPKAYSQKDSSPFGMPSSVSESIVADDADLFGTVWPLGETVKLDTTVDRQRLRDQCARLAELDYKLDYKQQLWIRQSD